MTDAREEKMTRLYSTARRVLESYSGGATEKEALRRTEKKIDGKMAPSPKERMHISWRTRLVKEGLLVRLETTGKVPGKWIPYYEIMAASTDTASHTELPQESPSTPTEREGGRLEEFGRYVKSMSFEAYATSIQSTVGGILDLVDGNRSLSRREIRRVCQNRIAPAVKRILTSREEGLPLTAPQEYFFESRGEDVQRHRSRKGLRGTLGVPIAGFPVSKSCLEGRLGWVFTGHIDQGNVIFPDLLDWAKYLTKVSEELGELGAKSIPES
jgi:hypothetical protein